MMDILFACIALFFACTTIGMSWDNKKLRTEVLLLKIEKFELQERVASDEWRN